MREKKRNHLKHIMSIATKNRQVNVCLMELQICCYSNRKTNKRLCSVFVFINEWELIIMQCRKNIKLDLANRQRSLIFDIIYLRRFCFAIAILKTHSLFKISSSLLGLSISRNIWKIIFLFSTPLKYKSSALEDICLIHNIFTSITRVWIYYNENG